MTDTTTGTRADSKPALVLHLTSGGEPLLFALDPQQAPALAERLPALVQRGSIETVTTKNDDDVTVNFGHVAVAYLDDLQRKSTVFGLSAR
jgi:hypothetical protein